MAASSNFTFCEIIATSSDRNFINGLDWKTLDVIIATEVKYDVFFVQRNYQSGIIRSTNGKHVSENRHLKLE